MRKLVLHRETLRLLSSQNLRMALGGNSGVTACQYCDSENTVCGDTYTCPNTTKVGQTVCLECEI
jgi:hypothetical protein